MVLRLAARGAHVDLYICTLLLPLAGSRAIATLAPELGINSCLLPSVEFHHTHVLEKSSTSFFDFDNVKLVQWINNVEHAWKTNIKSVCVPISYLLLSWTEWEFHHVLNNAALRSLDLEIPMHLQLFEL